ncbi:MAG: hypothetical protein ABR572_09260 [Cryomorphaceae bacterium]|nr:hypothetical protein [Flavobacteriales bacterium]
MNFSNVKTLIFLAAAFLLTSTTVFSQGEYFLGLDAGILSDRNHFVSETGQGVTAGAVGGHIGLAFGYRKNDFVVSMGFGQYMHGIRNFDLDRNTGVYSRANSGSNSVLNFVIPVTFAKEFQVYQNWYLGVGVGLQGLISRDAGHQTKSISYNIDQDAPMPWPDNVNADSTVTFYGTDRNFNMALETSLYVAYRVDGGAELFARFSYQGHINPTFEARHTFYSDNGTVNGTSSAVNSFIIGGGVRYYLPKSKDPRPE